MIGVRGQERVKNVGQKLVETGQTVPHHVHQPMITSLHIENFRCFKNLDVHDLGRCNIIVGPNSAGKTAFLEALFMPGGRHEMAFQLRQMRGMGQSILAPFKEMYDALWKDLFFKFSQSSIITISLKGTSENARTLKIFYKEQEALLIGFQGLPSSPGIPEPSKIVPLTFNTECEGATYENQALVVNNPQGSALQITGTLPPPARIAFVPFLGSANLAQQFSMIDQTKSGKARLLHAIKQVFPVVEDLSVQSFGVGQSDLYCTVAELENKIPLTLLSGGINRYLSILITIATMENGVVLVDEIDNGIFHQAFGKVWRSLLLFSKQCNVQLFASTHSKECLEALSPILGEEEVAGSFRVLRAGLQNGEGHSIKSFSGKDFKSALDVGIDPRQPD